MWLTPRLTVIPLPTIWPATWVPITNLPAGQHWNYVVLQGYSTDPTVIGDTAQFRADAVSLYQDVAANSPGVVPVLFETWARTYGSDLYTSYPTSDFPNGPLSMQAQVRDGYHLAAQDINAAPAVRSRIAPVGDAFQNDSFSTDLYDLICITLRASAICWPQPSSISKSTVTWAAATSRAL